MKKIYQRPIIRGLITGLLTLSIGISSAVLDNWDPTQKYFGIKLVIFFTLSILEIIYLIFCAAQDAREHAMISELEKQKVAYETALTGIIQVSKSNASGLNDAIHEFNLSGQLDKKIWTYKKACYELCTIIYLFISELTGNKDCEIAYVRLNEKVDGEISMFAFKNLTGQTPGLLNKKRNFLNSDTVQYFDMKLFAGNQDKTKVLYGSDNINIHFYRTSEQREKEPDKYNQFIAIPVFCDNTKMVGLLEIACLKGCSLGNDASAVEDIANRYFVPYANLFLLLHKIEKALQLGITVP